MDTHRKQFCGGNCLLANLFQMFHQTWSQHTRKFPSAIKPSLLTAFLQLEFVREGTVALHLFNRINILESMRFLKAINNILLESSVYVVFAGSIGKRQYMSWKNCQANRKSRMIRMFIAFYCFKTYWMLHKVSL